MPVSSHNESFSCELPLHFHRCILRITELILLSFLYRIITADNQKKIHAARMALFTHTTSYHSLLKKAGYIYYRNLFHIPDNTAYLTFNRLLHSLSAYKDRFILSSVKRQYLMKNGKPDNKNTLNNGTLSVFSFITIT